MSTAIPQKIYLTESDKVTFECPKCHASKNADISKYKKMTSSVTLKVKCPCGNVYSVTLERRKHYRKETKFPGIFTFRPLVGNDQKGPMTVLDISKGGLKFKMLSTPIFIRGDIIEVEFNLDNKNRTQIKKQVYVRNIKDNFIHVEFCSFNTNDSGDKALGFYLY